MRLTLLPVPLSIALMFALSLGLPAARGQQGKQEEKAKVGEKENQKEKVKVKIEERKPEGIELFPRGYLGHEAMGAALRKVARAQPDRVRVEVLARSGQGREVWIVTVGKAEPTSKPAVLVVANLEADHVVGSQVALGLIESLAASPGGSTGWLDRVTLYVVPRLNVDGAERALATAPAIAFRTNLRPIDRDRDGRLGEDGPDDLNGDGVVTRMRIKDPVTATLVPEPNEPRLLRRADTAKGERALYAEEDEGRDDDGDGLRNEDPPGGVNLNRNWPHRWTEFDPEAGFSPASEPEVFALIGFAFAHPEIAAVWSFGLNDNLRVAPVKPDSTLAEADLPFFVELSRVFARTAAPKDPPKGGSRAGDGAPVPGATTDGALSEWAYHQFGVVGLASRLWVTPEIPAPVEAKEKEKEKEKEKRTIPDGGEPRWLYWNDHVTGGRAFVPFLAVDHPTLGKVEVGGWRPGVRLNPPMAQVGAITDAHLAFLNELAARLPRLAVPEVKVEARGGRLFAVSAVVANEGSLPTAMAQAVITRKGPPVLVRLVPGKARILAGRALERIDTLAGSGGRREFSWIVFAPEGVDSIRLEVSCPKAGRVDRKVELK